jgi:hypothetical protein
MKNKSITSPLNLMKKEFLFYLLEDVNNSVAESLLWETLLKFWLISLIYLKLKYVAKKC